MVSYSITYNGDLACTAVHGPSGGAITTDAPVDVGGLARTFSPTDLLGAALASCILTTMALVAKKNGLELAGATATTDKHMSTDLPRRIIGLPTQVHVPLPANHPLREKLEGAAKHCPVHQSLHTDIATPIEFIWQDATV